MSAAKANSAMISDDNNYQFILRNYILELEIKNKILKNPLFQRPNRIQIPPSSENNVQSFDQQPSEDMYPKPQFVADPDDEVLANLDDHEALTKQGYLFDRIFFGLLFLLIALLAHSYGMAMGKLLIIASLVSTSIYMCFPIHFVSKLCEFLEWTLIVSGILIKMQISSAQTMIGFVDAFLALVCRLAYQISGISRVKTRMKKIVQEIKDGNSSTGCIEEYQRVRMRLFTLRMIFLSFNSLLAFYSVFFLLMARPWSLEDNIFNLLRDELQKRG